MKDFIIGTEAQRDSYRVDLKCPNCGLHGAAKVSEEDYPFTDNRRFSVDEVTPGFSVLNAGGAVTEMEIACDECDVSARPSGPCSVNVTASGASQAGDNSTRAKPLGYFRRR